MNLRTGEFHSSDGLCFFREPDGSVTVTAHSTDLNTVLSAVTLTPQMWASVIASMSPAGETGETWETACKFHGATI